MNFKTSQSSKIWSSLLAGFLLFFVAFSAVHAVAHIDDAQPNHTSDCEICKILSSAGGLALPIILFFAAILALFAAIKFSAPRRFSFHSKDLFKSLRSRAPPALTAA